MDLLSASCCPFSRGHRWHRPWPWWSPNPARASGSAAKVSFFLRPVDLFPLHQMPRSTGFVFPLVPGTKNIPWCFLSNTCPVLDYRWRFLSGSSRLPVPLPCGLRDAKRWRSSPGSAGPSLANIVCLASCSSRTLFYFLYRWYPQRNCACTDIAPVCSSVVAS